MPEPMMGPPANTRIWVAAGFTDSDAALMAWRPRCGGYFRRTPFLCGETKYVATSREHETMRLILRPSAAAGDT